MARSCAFLTNKVCGALAVFGLPRKGADNKGGHASRSYKTTQYQAHLT